MKNKKHFTLIELLIVVTIIAILVAMLLPILHRAKYKARLAICMNNLKQIATMTHVYANDSNDLYPERKDITSNSGIKATNLKGGVDDRDPIRPYLPINKIMNDNFVTPVDLENSTQKRIESPFLPSIAKI